MVNLQVASRAAATGRRSAHEPGTFLGLNRSGWLLAAPALMPVLLFSVYPLLQGMYLGFTDAAAGYSGRTFTGWENYARLIQDKLFWQSFRVGAIWAVSVTLLQFVAGLGLALLLNESFRGRAIARALSVLPWAMPPVVIGVMWKVVYHPTAGLLNTSLDAVGIHTTTNWLTSTTWALPAVIVVGVWAGMPPTTVVLLGALQNVPNELREAAALDGAGVLASFRYVTWPAIRPVAIAISSLDFIWNFNSFGLVYVLTGGGPAGTTKLPMLFSYEAAFSFGEYGYAAAMGNVLVLVMLAVMLVYLRKRLQKEA